MSFLVPKGSFWQKGPLGKKKAHQRNSVEVGIIFLLLATSRDWQGPLDALKFFFCKIGQNHQLYHPRTTYNRKDKSIAYTVQKI